VNDVALVTLDTLRKDAFDEHFDWLPGVRFENAWSTSHWTGPVHASLFTGLYPGEAGLYAHNRTFDHPDPVLPERLRDAGYETRAFSSNVIVSAEFGFDRGFETFQGSWNVERALSDEEVYDWHTLLRDDQRPRTYLRGFRESVGDGTDTVASLRQGLALATGRRALDYGAQRAVDTLGEATFGEDAFCYVNLMEAHAPYRPPPAFRTVTSYELPDHPLYAAPDADESADAAVVTDAGAEADATTGEATAAVDGFDPVAARRAYADSVRYLSDRYRALFGTLQAEFDYVITVADHGETFGEHGFYEHTYGIYPEATHVPVVVSGEGLADERREETVSLLDVHRTIATLTGVQDDGRGQDLLDDPDSREYLTEYRGIPLARQVDSLREMGVSDEAIGAYDESLFGMAFRDGSYAYQTPTGLQTRGEPPVDDPAARIATLLDDVEVRGGGEDQAAISSGVVDRLEHLGYV
jgi:arylsulfatase A-like enzyme